MHGSADSDEQDDDNHEELLYSVVYCSRAAASLDADAINQLVKAAQRHNSRESITGWLVFSNGIFFQWLEGPLMKVKRLMSTIAADRRHNSLVVLSETEEMRSRVFVDWDMELVSADDIKAVLFDAIDATNDSKSAEALRGMLTELDTRGVSAPR